MEKIVQRVLDNGGLVLALTSIMLASGIVTTGDTINANKTTEVVESKEVLKQEVLPTIDRQEHIQRKSQVVMASRSSEVERKREKQYSDEDLYWLARIVSAEAKGEPVEGQIAVANVVLNRVASDKFPDTVKDVIFQKGQFSPVANDTIYEEPTEQAVESAKKALEGERVVGEDVLFFYNPDTASSRWLDSRKKAKKIGNHRFTY